MFQLTKCFGIKIIFINLVLILVVSSVNGVCGFGLECGNGEEEQRPV